MAGDEAERAVRSHWNSYGLFTVLMKWGAIISLATALLVIFIISN